MLFSVVYNLYILLVLFIFSTFRMEKIYDPKKAFTITNRKMHGDTDHTIWEGAKLKGYPVATYSRGKLVFKDDKFVGEKDTAN